MYQLLSVLLSFSIIPILIKKKIKLSYTLLITAGVLGILSNIGISNILKSVSNVVIDPASRTTVLTVTMVSILGGLMGRYKILDRIVETLEGIIKNKKNILMIIPAFVGLLVIPGGALLSAPFINDLGQDLKLPPARRAAINLIFRHIAMFIMPYATGILIVLSSFLDLNVIKIIGLNFIFISILLLIGYFLFIRDIEVEILQKRENLSKNLVKLAIFTSPIYVPVMISLLVGLPFYITLLFSVVIVYFLSDKKNFIKNFFNSISWNTVLAVTSILIIKGIILNMDSLLTIFNTLFTNSENIVYILVIFLLTSIFFGFITGNQGAALAVILPMISQLEVSEAMLYNYIYFAYITSFMGYFFSPLHLCQVFTLEVMGVNTGELYREYRKYAVFMFIVLMGTFFLFRLIWG